MALTVADLQAIACCQYGCTGIVYFVSTAGNDSHTGKTPAAADAFLTVTQACSVAVAGDLIVVGPGTFNEGTNNLIPADGVSLFGFGMGATIFQSTLGQIPIPFVHIPSNATLQDFTIIGPQDNSFGGMGCGNSQSAFVNAVVRRVEIQHGIDGVYVQKSGACSAKFYDIVIDNEFDLIVSFFAGPHTLDFFNPTLRSTATGSNNSRGIIAASTTSLIRVYDGSIKTDNASNGVNSGCVYLTTAGAKAELYGTKLSSRGDASSFDTFNSGAGTIRFFDVNYDPTKVSGTAPVVRQGQKGLDFTNIKDATGAHTLANITVPAVTMLTNLPTIPANWITAAGINAGALSGKGDWATAATAASIITKLSDGTINVGGIDAGVITQIQSGLATSSDILVIETSLGQIHGPIINLATMFETPGAGVYRYTAASLVNAPSGGNIPGYIALNHNTGGTDALTIQQGGNPVTGATIRVFLKSSYASNPQTAPCLGSTTSDNLGHWLEPVFVPPGAIYAIVVSAVGDQTQEVDVTV